jgi:hypothetical protein
MTYEHQMDRTRFELIRRRNEAKAKDAEVNAEEQRVVKGIITEFRRPLIESLFNRLLVKPDQLPEGQ